MKNVYRGNSAVYHLPSYSRYFFNKLILPRLFGLLMSCDHKLCHSKWMGLMVCCLLQVNKVIVIFIVIAEEA